MKVKITGYAKLLIFKSEGGQTHPLVPPSRHHSKSEKTGWRQYKRIMRNKA